MEKLHYIDADVVCLLSKLNTYDYIIVGSGFGGGPMADDLARKKKRVLLIERGEVIFSTHVLNTSRPYFGRGASNSPEGNETIYDSVKAKVQCSEGSETYVGGPVYCVGGRSNLWGIWTPEISSQTLEKYFPAEVVSYLQEGGGYAKAFNFMTQNSQESEPYPIDSGQMTQSEIDGVKSTLQAAIPDVDWDLMPVAAEFNSSAPYKFPQGAYSTTLAIMNKIFAKDQYLTVLLDTEVISVEHSKTENAQDPTEERKVHSIKFRNGADTTIKDLPVGNAKVIISAGTIGTASIALNSGFQLLNPLVGKGIIDHDICYVRFSMEKEGEMKKPLNLKTLITIEDRLCLLTVTVNANFFLAGCSASLPTTHFYDRRGRLIDGKDRRLRDQGAFDTICILFEFVADLQDSNEVLNLASVNPVLSITRPPLANAVDSGMLEFVKNIRDQFVYDGNPPTPEPPIPQPSHMGFGVFAHECGTMRMDGPQGNGGVVDSNLKMKGFENLWVCDMSVFPVCPEANPALTLAALSIRMADQFVPDPQQPDLPPIGPGEI
ncbi:hypothetical protein F5Y00DRAFT_270173 [Daldinia vernicosa]|uniref:uncharacterized protein n=1 Tax=Daldinia vernicosa TaxID=114800 RepID=UPI0020078C05|nr:uncharacterized protein F5Y00DRAFT_270173 [Daldinia vernicosa]KAI0848441.1 hypothetical protein F5Y00DRAFT_270173 [Daldinia vernicosa]